MPLQSQKHCPQCGPTLAVKNEPPGCSENIGMGALAVLTCGFGLVFAVPWAIYRGLQANHWHCQRCGRRVV